jgi:hypothetical protein
LGKDANNKLILSDATMVAINTFRRKFADSQPKIIEKGPHFRDNTLLETYNAYAQAERQWGYNYNKGALFEDGVLSCVLLYVPANVVQKFSQGMYYLQDKSEKFSRRDTLRNGKNNFYLVSRGPSVDFSLKGSCIDIVFGGVARCASPPDTAPTAWLFVGIGFQNLCRTKTSNLRSLCSQNHSRSLGV